MDEINREYTETQNENGCDQEVEVPLSEEPLQDPVIQAVQERDEYRDRMQRAQAELVNFKRRTADEKVETVKREKTRVFSTL